MLSKWAYFFTSSQQDFPGWTQSTAATSTGGANRRLITVTPIVSITDVRL